MMLRALATLPMLGPVVALAAPFQDALSPVGPQSGHIYDLWLVMLAVTTVAFVATMIALVLSLTRARRGDESTPPDITFFTAPQSGLKRSVIAGVSVTVVLLLVLLVASVFTDRALARLPLRNAVTVEITAHQWWWEVKYLDDEPARTFVTANELHVPVGRPVVAKLQSPDVIHSFWVPNVHGKKDLIPGQESLIQFRVDRAGTYRGQCAEFCGFEHALMALHVIAVPEADYEQWTQAQRQSAPEPTTAETQRGRQVVLTSTCGMCHAIQGTTAQGRVGPELTHIATRPSLAAGTLPNTPQHLAAWILDPQRFKPGVNMPANALSDDDLRAVVAYLETLK